MLPVNFPVSFSDLKIFTSNKSIKSKGNQNTFFGKLLTKQFWADPGTTSYLVVRSDNEIFLMRLDYFLYGKASQCIYYKSSHRLMRE